MCISVIIPVYNSESFLREAVESCLKQPEVSEIIIIDDGSTDSSYNIAKNLAASKSSVIVKTHAQRQNLGISASRNLGINSSGYEYIAFLDADDYYLSDRFSFALNYLKSHPNCMAIAESIEVEHAANIDSANLSDTIIKTEVLPQNLFRTLLTSPNLFLSFNGILVRKSYFLATGLFDTSLQRSEDTDLLLRMALTCKLHAPKTGRIVARYRRHNQGIHRNSAFIAQNKVLLFEKWLNYAINTNLSFPFIWIILKKKIINESIYSNHTSRVFKVYRTIFHIALKPKVLFNALYYFFNEK